MYDKHTIPNYFVRMWITEKMLKLTPEQLANAKDLHEKILEVFRKNEPHLDEITILCVLENLYNELSSYIDIQNKKEGYLCSKTLR